jgi:hypothetical protein
MEISRENIKCMLCANNYSITKLYFKRKKKEGRNGKEGFKMSNTKTGSWKVVHISISKLVAQSMS